tara:strand:- start:721 stop:1053 length:333 start_codon:yes stop_codon:yes gene_type:complete
MMNKLFFEPKSGEVFLFNPTMTIHKYLELFGSPEQKHMFLLLDAASSESESKKTMAGISKSLHYTLKAERAQFGNGTTYEYTKQDLDLFLLDAMKHIMSGRAKQLENKGL